MGDPSNGVEELPGGWVLPGLVDAHVHLAFDMSGLGLRRASRDLVLANLALHRRAGVLLVRDVGAPPGVRLKGPHVISAGRFLAPAGGYTEGIYDPVPSDGLEDAALAELAAAGDGWVKVVADYPEGQLSSPAPLNYDLPVLAAAVDAVHAAGGRVAAHTTGAAAPTVVAAGVDSVEHGLGLDEDSVRALAARGGAWTPTLTSSLTLLEAEGASADHLRELIPLAHRLGVAILAGTDLTPAGSLAREVARLFEFGLAPVAALAAASTAARAYLG
ncbi:MAG: amidohydrolase family protein, partial [Acidimicrobiales bacterium]